MVASSGWSKPAWGWISGNYGPRQVICGGGYCSNSFHYATDLATGCDAPIYAANSGTVTYAGWSGSYGNFIKIDHGGGISTGYAHIRPGGLFVGYGQWVERRPADRRERHHRRVHRLPPALRGLRRLEPNQPGAVHGRSRGLPWLSIAPGRSRG